MKNRILLSTIFLLSVFSFATKAQVAMKDWRIHFAYNNTTKITQSENKVYAISDGALFFVDKLDGNIQLYNKMSGLNGSIISEISYDKANNQLLICYNNGNIDLITDGGVINVPDFYNKILNVNKNINNITIHDNKAYLSCNFGIVVLNLKKREITETYYIGPNASEVIVKQTTIHNNQIYALAYVESSGRKVYSIFYASLDNPNLVNFENWKKLAVLPTTNDSDLRSINSFGGKLFILDGFNLYEQSTNSEWIKYKESLWNVNISNGKMILTNGISAYVLNENFEEEKTSEVGYVHACVYDDKKNTLWLAKGSEGIFTYKQGEGILNKYNVDGPAVNTPWDMKFAGEKLIIVPGGRWSVENKWKGYVMIYEDGKWTNIDGDNIFAQTGKPVLDFVNIAIDPFDNSRFFVTSFGTGLYEFRNNSFYKKYDYQNSSGVIETIELSNPDRYVRLDGAIFDQEGNLFFNNMWVSSPIKILLKDGNWLQLGFPDFQEKPTWSKILISNTNPNQKWILSARWKQAPGIGIFDDNGTLSNKNDDSSVFYRKFIDTDKQGEMIIPDELYSIAQDKNGVIWVGTNVGPLLFYNPNNAIKDKDNGYTCSRVKIPRNDGTGLADNLLVEETIKAIAIDGANRKWIGTKNSGVYLLSENGQETIHHFTSDNSPLLSNDIFSIEINPKTGEVFFATGNGLISYQSDAADGENSFENVYAYPNPVRENFEGIITITGLIQDTQVKITDLNGNLICETTSNGSIATWDGKDLYGRKVNTGIYLALCVSKDGTQSTITKILVIN